MTDINGYRLCGALKTTNSGFSKWGFVERAGVRYFIKEFIDPVYPLCADLLDAETAERKRQICLEYEARKSLLYRTVNACSDGNLVHIEDFFRSGSHYYLVMERIEAIDPREIRSLSEADKARICRVLIHCVGRLHAQGVVHSDIKQDNILYRRLPSGKITGKLIDFDDCFWDRQPPRPDEEIHGDPVYMAPETFAMMQEEVGEIHAPIDVFALGIVFHQIFTGELPGFDRTAYDYPFEAVLDGAALGVSAGIPEEWRTLIAGMLEADSARRISLAEAETCMRAPGNGAKAKDAGGFWTAAGDL